MAEPDVAHVNVAEKLALIHDTWHPRVVGRVNEFHIKLVKLAGEFHWHHHEYEDELFLVLKGTLRMKLRNGEKTATEGEFLIVPHGVEHCPVAEGEVHILLFEPASTRNTGNITNERTVENPEWI